MNIGVESRRKWCRNHALSRHRKVRQRAFNNEAMSRHGVCFSKKIKFWSKLSRVALTKTLVKLGGLRIISHHIISPSLELESIFR